MFSIVEQGGFQYKVTEGDFVEVPLIQGEVGSEFSIDKVLLVADGDDVKIGTPLVSGVSVGAKIVGHGKGDKVLVIKRKRRKDYRRKNGHRQDYTTIQITSINS